MANIKGTNISSPIAPFTDQDIYATHSAIYGKGGYRSVETLKDMENIPEPRREEGMLIYVINDPTGIHTYQYLGGKFLRQRGNGIPVYDQQLIDDLGIEPPERYISIPSNSDLDGEVEEKTYKTSKNGTYIDILFSAIRALQSEVAKLKNTFEYGIESYTGTQTAMSSVVRDYGDIEEEEPMWAIMEDNLAEVEKIELVESNTSLSGENIEFALDPAFNPYCTIPNTMKWTATDVIKEVTDSKIYVYLTLTKSDIKVNLEDPNEEEITVNLGLVKNIPLADVYNVLFVISRQQEIKGSYYGHNFIWFSISNAKNGLTLREGYLTENGEVSIDPVYFEDIKRYSLHTITFPRSELYKFKVYSKWQNFSNQVIPSTPSEQDYKFKAAHITIRSVDTYATMGKLKDQILNNELIYVEDTGKLWIKTDNNLKTISGGGGGSDTPDTPDIDDTGMTQEEMIKALAEMGIVKESESGDLSIENLTLGDVTFIHQATGKRFNFTVNESGNLESREIGNDNTKFSNIIKTNNVKFADTDVRGFIGTLRTIVNSTAATSSKRSLDAGLNSDRIKIGAFYAPLASDLAHGCSHAYVELENTSDIDTNLEGCYLHYTRPDNNGNQRVYHLALTGTIPAGGTYLIRGKRYENSNNPNVYINVDTYDQEWYITTNSGNAELIDFTVISRDISKVKAAGYGFALTYDYPDLNYNTPLIFDNSAGQVVGNSDASLGTYTGSYLSSYLFDWRFIDAIYYNKHVANDSNVGYWARGSAVTLTSNSLYKNTFELDPAKQAFQALNSKDSSRVRWASANDTQVLSLSREYIEFPHSNEKCAVSNFTPRASWENKNVCTDKTKLDHNKPNMVSCSFGTNIYTTRCFNWISVGYYDEFVWIRRQGTEQWSKAESYLPIHSAVIRSISDDASGEKPKITINISDGGFANGTNISEYSIICDSDHNKVLSGISPIYNGTNYDFNVSDTTGLVIGKTYILKRGDDEVAGTTYPKKKFFNANVTNAVYARMTGNFPANNDFYTSHKVIVDVVGTAQTSKTVYEYVVGRPDKNGNPDIEHTSNIRTFTLYPTTFTPQVYQTTDQQGFHWIEYQVWSAAAIALNKKIEEDQKTRSIIPILVNTGDMTQNGTRINEWLDYNIGGEPLFNHLEQMTVVGNNDLCNTNVSELGTGDDNGKSNSYFHHLFFCYEVGNVLSGSNNFVFEPIIGNKYVPSTYFYDTANYRFLMVNSEITEINCKNWFGQVNGTSTVNIYTGWTVGSRSDQVYVNGFTTIYTMLWNILTDARQKGKEVIVMCHESPFTVITSDSLLKAEQATARSISTSKALVGSHLNQISKNENGSNESPRGVYWFSRLMEYFGVKVVLCGHKHTYTCSYPLREYYYYGENENKDSLTNGVMEMPNTLANDTANFIHTSDGVKKDLSKFPLTKRARVSTTSDKGFYPYTPVENLTGGVVYFMCQATGYKLTSNKELPSPDQKYTMVLPQTTSKYDNSTQKYKDTADVEQKYPMFSIMSLVNSTISIKLGRITNIMVKGTFNQSTYSTSAVGFQWLITNNTNNYGTWQGEERELISI